MPRALSVSAASIGPGKVPSFRCYVYHVFRHSWRYISCSAQDLFLERGKVCGAERDVFFCLHTCALVLCKNRGALATALPPSMPRVSHFIGGADPAGNHGAQMGGACFDSGGGAWAKWCGELLPAGCGSRHFRVLPERRRESEQAHQCENTAPAGLLLHALLHVSGVGWCRKSGIPIVYVSFSCLELAGKVTNHRFSLQHLLSIVCVPLLRQISGQIHAAHNLEPTSERPPAGTQAFSVFVVILLFLSRT